MPEPSTIGVLLQRIRNGDQDAATKLHQLFDPLVRISARQLLNRSALQRMLESGDISQMVWTNFFLRVLEGSYQALEEETQLVRLLRTMVRNRVYKESRRAQTVSRDRYRFEDEESCLEGLRSDDPSPSQTALAQELYSELRRRLPPQVWRLLERRILGWSWQELSQESQEAAGTLRMRVFRSVLRLLQECEDIRPAFQIIQIRNSCG